MSALPSYARIIFDGYGEEFDPSVLRTEMERGIPKQAIQNTQVLQKVNATILFLNAADIDSFETWYFTDIKRIGWFDVKHPRTKQLKSMRFEGGKLGPLSPKTSGFYIASYSVVLEYMR